MRKLEIKDTGTLVILLLGLHEGPNVPYTEAAVASKLANGLSALNESEKPGTVRIKEGGGELELTEREFEFLRLRVEAGNYPTAFCEAAAAMPEWFAGITKYESKDEKVTPIERPVARAKKK